MSHVAGKKRPRADGNVKSSKKVKVSSIEAKPPSAAPSKKQAGPDATVTTGKKREEEKYRPQAYKSDKKPEPYLNGTSSREAHAKQKAVAHDRKGAKPNADLTARSKKLWERLRRKSHVPKDERDQLVSELFEIISGRVKDFVFKHDAVRVIQCALKYSTPVQRKQITSELKGTFRELAESKYAKFLIAKLVVGDHESRDLVVREFYGHVKRLIRHPEASWILDDIYRGIATKHQKAVLLREWYGPEFVVFAKTQPDADEVTADLEDILRQNPEKRGPIMQHLRDMTNQLVQKKTVGFTMLHDALLQYFLNCKRHSPEAVEFLSMLRDDEEGETYKNLAFTRSGSRLVCLALAHGSSKDRRAILKFFKTHMKLLASDQYGHKVLLAAYDVIDDTVTTAKLVFPELLSKDLDAESRDRELLSQVEHLTARIPLLYLLSADAPKWLLPEETAAAIREVREVRTETSKKDADVRRTELVKAISQPLLDLVASQAKFLMRSAFGCKFITEVLFGALGDKAAALDAIALVATQEADSDEARLELEEIRASVAVGRMLKSLVQGGRFMAATKTVVLVEPPLMFHDVLYKLIRGDGDGETQANKDEVVVWANGPNAFTVLAMLEAQDFSHKEELTSTLTQRAHELNADKPGPKIILETIGERTTSRVSEAATTKKKTKKGKPSKSTT